MAGMKTDTAPSCANCQQLQEQLNAQQAQLEAFQVRQASLEAALAQVQAQLAAARKDSSTSSKPPSSDIVKPPKPPPPPGQDRPRRGGQPGHPQHECPLAPPELLTAPPHDYLLEICPDCGCGLRPAGDDARVVQQMELGEVPTLVAEHRSTPGRRPPRL